MSKNASSKRIGRLRLDESGASDGIELCDLLHESGCVLPKEIVVASVRANYEARCQPSAGREIDTRCALAIDYSLRQLGLHQDSGEDFFTLHKEGRWVSLGFFQWDDGVLEVCEGVKTVIEPYESLTDCLKRLIDNSTLCRYIRSKATYTVLCLSDDQRVATCLQDAYKQVCKDNVGYGMCEATLTPRFAHGDSLARGAALHALMLSGGLDGFLLLDAMPFEIALVYGDHRLPMISADTTIPFSESQRIGLREGESLSLELSAADEPNLRRRYALPFDTRRLASIASRRAPLDVTVDVDAGSSVSVTVQEGTWKQHFVLRDLKPVPRTTEARQAGAANLPDGLMELVATLDEVDLGVRALSPAEINTPAGQSILTVQQRLLSAIEKMEAKYYPALGRPFDPHRHEAFSSVRDPTLPANTIVDEVRRGYTYRGRVIRYSLVRVANPS